MNAMKWTIGLALVLTAIAGLLVGCASAPASRAEQNTILQESAAARPGHRALCETAAALLDRLAGGAFATLPVAERISLVAAHRLALHPVGRLEVMAPWNRDAYAVRDLLVPELIQTYYDSPAGWAEVGYRRPYGECGEGREYTRPEA